MSYEQTVWLARETNKIGCILLHLKIIKETRITYQNVKKLLTYNVRGKKRYFLNDIFTKKRGEKSTKIFKSNFPCETFFYHVLDMHYQ